MSNNLTRTPATQEQVDDLLNARKSTEKVPILKHKAENCVMRELKEVAIRACDNEIRALAQCAEGRVLSVVWHCRSYSKAVDACMHKFAKDEPLKDELRRRHAVKFPSCVKGYKQSSNTIKGEEASV